MNRVVGRSFFAAAIGVTVLATAGLARAATVTWDPNGGSRDWNDASNWTTGTVPGPNDDVVANGSVADNRIEINTSIDVKSITTTSSYNRNITFTGSSANTIRVRGNLTLNGSGNFECASGTTQIDGNVTVPTSVTFSGNDGTVTILGSVIQTGGTINSLGGTVTIGGSVTVSGGSFNGGAGLLVINGSVNIPTGGTFRASSTTTRLGGAFVDTGGTYNDNGGNMVLASKTNQTHTFGGSIFRRTTINDGMVGYWNLDENTGTTVADNSGFNNNGTSSNLTWASASPPSLAFTNTSYGTFNGTSSRIALTVVKMPTANETQSIAAWVNINAMPASASTIVSLTGASSAVKFGLSATQLRVLRNDGTALVTTAAPSTGTWHHVAYTWNGTNNWLYIDGAIVTATVAGHDTAALTAGFIGATSASADFFNGSIDEVRIYDRLLTSAEVSALALGRTPSTSIATHTFSDAYTASIGTNVADLIIASGTVTGSSTITIEGSWYNYGGRFTGTGTVTFTSAAAESLQSGGSSFSALTINRSGANYTIRDRLWIPNGAFTLSAGRIQLASYTMHVGSMSITAGTTFTVGTGTVVFDGSSNITLPSSVLTTYNALRLEDATETSLVGYWKLDEGTGPSSRDWSGLGNTGSLSASGAIWVSPSTTIGFDNGSAMSFNGINGYVSGGTTSLPAANAAQTISAWVNITALPASASSVVALTGASSAVKLGLSATNLRVLRNDGTALIQTTAPSTGAWHHVAYTWNGSSNNLYIDGTAVSPTSTAHDGAAVTGAFIGATSAAADFFSGKIDDVRVYNVALTATQVAQLAAGRYAGTGGYATTTLGANTTVASSFALDAANLSSGTFTFNHSLTSAAAEINAGTYTVGSNAQQFQGGLTVNPGGALTLATSGGSVQIASAKTLTMDGTLNGSSTGAVIRSVSGTYGFSVGSTAAARPTLNITGLTVQNTNASGMRVNVNTAAVTTFTRFDNLVFLSGTTTYLNIYATSLYLNSSGTRFGITTGGVSDGTLPTNNVTLAGNGTSDGETRIMFGTATCAAAQTTAGSCTTTWKSDDDPDGNGVGNTLATNGAVVQYMRSISTDTAGSIEGLPTAAFDWSTFTYYSTYVTFHDTSGSADTVYVRDQAGTARYQWSTPSGETIVGTPRWNTISGGHYLFVALASGKVYRLIDNGSSLAADSSGSWAGANNPFDCGCTIVTPLGLDTTNLYWGGTTSGPIQKVWTLGQVSRSQPMGSPLTITPTITTSAPAQSTSGATTYLFLGLVGNLVKINVTTQVLDSTNTNPGSAAIRGRILPAFSYSRVFAGDDAGTMWAIDPNNFAGTNKIWSYAIPGDSIQSSPYLDTNAAALGLYFGTDGGKIVGLNWFSGAALTGFPFVPLSTTDRIRSALLSQGGLLVAGTTTGKLVFIDRNTGFGPAVARLYSFGPTESVSGIAYDTNASRYMVATSDSATNDGRLYYIDVIADPTPASP